MFTNFTKRIINILVFVMLVYMMSPVSFAQTTSSQVQQVDGSGPQVILASVYDKSRPLASMIPVAAPNTFGILPRRPAAPKTLKSAGNDITDASIVQSESLVRTLTFGRDSSVAFVRRIMTAMRSFCLITWPTVGYLASLPSASPIISINVLRFRLPLTPLARGTGMISNTALQSLMITQNLASGRMAII